MRRASLSLTLLLACCAAPPRVEDRTDPVRAYETFRWRMSQGQHEAEFECLSDALRARFGMESRHDWKDARVTALAQGSRFVRAVLRSKVVGDASMDRGRARLAIRVRVFVFRFTGRVWMRPVPVLRVYFAGEPRPLYQHLPGLALRLGEDAIGVRIPPEVRGAAVCMAEEAGTRIGRLGARVEWFLDDCAMGDETPAKVKGDVEKSREETK